MSTEESQAKRDAVYKFFALEVGESSALGADVRLEVHPRTTVLVGRNGAGKSALMEGIIAGSRGATGVVSDDQPDPARFACEISLTRESTAATVRYECRWRPAQRPNDAEALSFENSTQDETRLAPIAETCRIVGNEGKEDHYLWQLAEGLLKRNDGTTDIVPNGRGLLNWWISCRQKFSFNNTVSPLHDMLSFLFAHYVRAGVPRAEKGREAAVVSSRVASANKWERRYEHISWSIRRLVRQLAEWHVEARHLVEEFIAVGQRLQLFARVEIHRVNNPEHSADPRAPSDLVSASVDGVDLGLLSDGTQRVLLIISLLIDPKVPLLLIEEPEIAVHPGLLTRLLDEISAYSLDRQVILSTQSPQVVNWAAPDSLRLVERAGGQTRVRSLNAQEHQRIANYLNDEGMLGEYLFAGGLDG